MIKDTIRESMRHCVDILEDNRIIDDQKAVELKVRIERYDRDAYSEVSGLLDELIDLRNPTIEEEAAQEVVQDITQ